MDILLLASLIALPIGLCALSRRRIEECLPPAAFAEILAAYALSCFQALGLMRWLALCAAGALWLAALVRMGRFGFPRGLKALGQNLFTPQLLCFAVLLALFAFSGGEHIVYATDDIYYWGIEAHSIFAHDGLVDASRHLAPRFMTYTPGMQLFQWMGLSIAGEWSEGVLYVLLWAFYALCMLPFLKGMTWRRAWLIPVALVLMLVVPCVFNADAYGMLRVDTALGLCLAYAMAQVWRLIREENAGGWELGCLTFGLCALVLLKQVGVGWALLPLSLLWIGRKRRRGLRVGMAAATAAPFLVFASWKAVCSAFLLTGAHLNNAAGQIGEILGGTWIPSVAFGEMARTLARLFTATPAALEAAGYSALTLPKLAWLIVLILIPLVLGWSGGRFREARGLAVWSLVSFLVTLVALSFVLEVGLNSEAIGAYENFAFQYALIERYFCPFFFGLAGLSVLSLADSSVSLRRNWLRPAAAVIAAVLVLVGVDWDGMRINFVPDAYAQAHPEGQFADILAENFWMDDLEEPQEAIVFYGIDPYPFKPEWIQYAVAPAKLVFTTDDSLSDEAFRSYLTNAHITHVVFMDDWNTVYQNALNYTEDEWLDVLTAYAVRWEDGDPVIEY